MGQKDAYYFTHDSNAKDDPKCIMLIEELGLEGYGIFWVLIETLRDQPEYKADLRILPGLARRYNTSLEKMKSVISRYQLFQVHDDEFFFSQSLIHRLKPLNEKRQKARLAANIRWGNADAYADALPVHSERNASRVKESKVKQSKVKQRESKNPRFQKPDFNDVLEFFSLKGYKNEAQKFWDYYESVGWTVGRQNKKMSSWKNAASGWINRINDFKTADNGKNISFTEAARNW